MTNNTIKDTVTYFAKVWIISGRKCCLTNNIIIKKGLVMYLFCTLSNYNYFYNYLVACWHHFPVVLFRIRIVVAYPTPGLQVTYTKQKWQFWRIRQSTVEWSDFWKTNLGTFQVVVNCFGTPNPKFYLNLLLFQNLTRPQKIPKKPKKHQS